MGDTNVKVTRALRITRIVMACLVGLFGVIAIVQIILFPYVTIKFDAGIGAQQLPSMSVKKGSDINDLPVPLKPGSYFVGWSLSKRSSETIENLHNITNGTTLYAVWDGVEKYAVLMADGIVYDYVNIFAVRDVGITAAELNDRWRILDDYAADNQNLVDVHGVKVDRSNHYQKFLGWRYKNADNQDNELLYDQGVWTWVQRDADGNIKSSEIIDEDNRFYPPNYRTTFEAMFTYRQLRLEFYSQDAIKAADCGTILVKPGDTDIVLPTYNNYDPQGRTHFSHWELETKSKLNDEGLLSLEIQNLLKNVNTRFAAGEIISAADPFWYYFGKSMKVVSSKDKTLATTIRFRAVYWEDSSSDKYTTVIEADNLDDTSPRVIPVTSFNNLSLDNPVVYDRNEYAICLFKDAAIESYSFYDHLGQYHQIAVADDMTENLKLAIGDDSKPYYFNGNYAINIHVKFKPVDINLRFNYGRGLAVLPNYNIIVGETTANYIAHVGDNFTLLNAEKYLRSDWLFYGWRLRGDNSDTVYAAGEKFVVPHMDTTNGATLQFDAVWRMSRLLYDFDFGGGDWAEEPDFKIMKGAYGDQVRIVPDIPVRFGYIFGGWFLNDETELRQPNSVLEVGPAIQTLHAYWIPKKINMTFYSKTDNSGQLQPNYLQGYDMVYVGENIKLIGLTENRYYSFLGWQIGNDVVKGNQTICFDSETLLKLNAVEDAETVRVKIYAKQERRTVDIEYYYVARDEEIRLTPADWVTEIPQTARFFDYAPFNLSNRDLDRFGCEFRGWEYAVDNKVVRESITSFAMVPGGIQKIRVYAASVPKTFTVEYYDHAGNKFYTDANSEGVINNLTYTGTVDLINEAKLADFNIDKYIDGWGDFAGWSMEPDYAAGNPNIIYNVADYPVTERLRLQLLDEDNDILNVNNMYKIAIDRHNIKISSGVDAKYVLKLYAVYANEYINVYYPNNNHYIYPVFTYNYEKATMGGNLVAPDKPDFDTYLKLGVTVHDNNGFADIEGRNFIGWMIKPTSDQVTGELRGQFVNKLWLPGEAIPAVDFDLTFEAKYETQSNQVKNVTVGNRTYRVAVLPTTGIASPQTIYNVDIVALPTPDQVYDEVKNEWVPGTYTLKTGTITVKSDRPVSIVASANGKIILEPGAIVSDQVTEFYVNDNLEINGSVIVGKNFKRYLVKKGEPIYDINVNPKAFSLAQNISAKYDIEAAYKYGLLVSKTEIGNPDKKLLAVPSNVSLNSNELRQCLIDNQINHIVSYAFTGTTSLTTIDLNIDGLQIDDQALFSTYAKTIILPKFGTINEGVCSVKAECISGVQYALTKVQFGSDNNSNYACVENGFVYYGLNKNRIMYVLPNAATRDLEYIDKDLLISPDVSVINAYALAARFDSSTSWARINSITAENINIDLTKLIGVPNSIPKFVNKDNSHQDLTKKIQAYVKVLEFSCDDYPVQKLEYKYGQPFIVFDPKENNPYDFVFDRPWYKFVGWTSTNGIYKTGEVYKVGIDDRMLGDGFVIKFSASTNSSWLSYPIKFHIFDGTYDLEYKPTQFINISDETYTLDQIINNKKLDLKNIFLPGADLTFTRGGVKYQFVGWGTNAVGTKLDDRLWSNTNTNYRILPNKTRSATLTSGVALNGIYDYYALYDKVTDNLLFTLDNGVYSVKQSTNANPTSIYIPFAHYNNGYMVPVMHIQDYAFNSLSNIKDIIIGGAISNIGTGAFANLQANITFQYDADNFIKFNKEGSYQLTIGDQAFYGNTVITELMLPQCLTTIGDSAFASCTNLRTVRFVNDTSSINRIGNFAFSNDSAMEHNAIVYYIINDQDDSTGNRRFWEVGEGVFMNTQIKRSLPNNTKLVWLGTLLQVLNASVTLRIEEEKIAGYAFANINNSVGINPVTTLTFANPNTKIAKNTFANLDSEISQINMPQLDPKNIHESAFMSINSSHQDVTVKVGPGLAWNKFKCPSNVHFS